MVNFVWITEIFQHNYLLVKKKPFKITNAKLDFVSSKKKKKTQKIKIYVTIQDKWKMMSQTLGHHFLKPALQSISSSTVFFRHFHQKYVIFNSEFLLNIFMKNM
jgi:hypothetical protein